MAAVSEALCSGGSSPASVSPGTSAGQLDVRSITQHSVVSSHRDAAAVCVAGHL